MSETADASKFGGLFERWNPRKLSYVLIDSKDYAKWKNWTLHVETVAPRDGHDDMILAIAKGTT